MVKYRVIVNGSVMIVTDIANTRIWLGPNPPPSTFASMMAPTLKQLVLEGKAELIIIAKPNEMLYCPFCGYPIGIVTRSGQYTCPACKRVLNVEVEEEEVSVQ